MGGGCDAVAVRGSLSKVWGGGCDAVSVERQFKEGFGRRM